MDNYNMPAWSVSMYILFYFTTTFHISSSVVSYLYFRSIITGSLQRQIPLLSLTWLCCARPEHHEGDEETSKTQGKLHFARLLTITPVTHMSNKVFRYLKGNIGSWQFQKLGPHARVMTSSVCPNSSMHKLNATKTVGSFVVLIVTNVLTGFDHWYSMPLLLTLRSSRRLGGFWHTPSVRLTPPTVHWLVEGKTLSLIITPISLISLSHWLIRIDIQLFSWCTVYTCLRPWPIHFPKCA